MLALLLDLVMELGSAELLRWPLKLRLAWCSGSELESLRHRLAAVLQSLFRRHRQRVE